MHHDRCVPANDLTNAMFNCFITGELRFTLGSNRVDVVGAAQTWNTNIVFSCTTQKRQHDVSSAVISATCHHVVERVNPFARFVWISIDILSRHAASQQGFAVTCGRHWLDPSLGRLPGSPGCRVTVCVPSHILAYWGCDNQSWVTFWGCSAVPLAIRPQVRWTSGSEADFESDIRVNGECVGRRSGSG